MVKKARYSPFGEFAGMRQVVNRDFVKYHLREALRGAVAEANGDEALSRRLHAETKLRLITMSEEELRELAKQTSSPERPVELAYKRHKQTVEELQATSSEWLKDLVPRTILGQEGKVTDNILIIEGEPTLRGELTSALTKAGFAVADVPDYPEALEKLDKFKCDMVIVDEVLPGGDGVEACSQLHRVFGSPIILLGEDSSGGAWTKAVEAGADLYLKKPFSYLELVARVKAILRRYKMATTLDKVADSDNNRNNLGKIIRQQRVTMPLTLQQLAAMSGVSPSHLGRVERGERFPSARILRRIAKPLGFEENELFALAGYLSPRSPSLGEENPAYSGGRLDPYVAGVLSQEPVDVQRAVIAILSILKSLARSIPKNKQVSCENEEA